jgi:hypothetical protein
LRFYSSVTETVPGTYFLPKQNVLRCVAFYMRGETDTNLEKLNIRGRIRVSRVEALNEWKLFPLEYGQELDAWACAWYDVVIAENFARLPYHPDALTIRRLQGYFHAGLSPAEAAEACFGGKH